MSAGAVVPKSPLRAHCHTPFESEGDNHCFGKRSCHLWAPNSFPRHAGAKLPMLARIASVATALYQFALLPSVLRRLLFVLLCRLLLLLLALTTSMLHISPPLDPTAPSEHLRPVMATEAVFNGNVKSNLRSPGRSMEPTACPDAAPSLVPARKAP